MLLRDAFKTFQGLPVSKRWSSVARSSDGGLVMALKFDELAFSSGILRHDSLVSEWGGRGVTAADYEWYRLLDGAVENRTPVKLIIAYKKGKGYDFVPKPEMIGKVEYWDKIRLAIKFIRA